MVLLIESLIDAKPFEFYKVCVIYPNVPVPALLDYWTPDDPPPLAELAIPVATDPIELPI